MITINGYFNGTSWNKDTRKFEIKTLGAPDNGAILCGLSVSGKDKEGAKVYGAPVEVKIQIKSSEEGRRVYGLVAGGDGMCECDGFFVPANWTNKEGKETKGHQFLVTDSTTFVKSDGQSKAKQAGQAETEAENNPWS